MHMALLSTTELACSRDVSHLNRHKQHIRNIHWWLSDELFHQKFMTRSRSHNKWEMHSPILFKMAMQILFELTLPKPMQKTQNLAVNSEWSYWKHLQMIPPLSHPMRYAWAVLQRLDDLISWSRMVFKQENSRSPTLVKDKVNLDTTMRKGNQQITTADDQLVKS